MSGLSEQERQAVNVAVDEAETCRCHGNDYGAPHIYDAVERIVAAREVAAQIGVAERFADAWGDCIQSEDLRDFAREIGGVS